MKKDEEELVSPIGAAMDHPVALIIMVIGLLYFVIKYLLPIALGR